MTSQEVMVEQSTTHSIGTETVNETEEAEIMHGVNPDNDRSELTIEERLAMLRWEQCEVWDGPTARIVEVVNEIEEENQVRIDFIRENGTRDSDVFEWPDRYSEEYKIVQMIEDERLPFDVSRLDTTSLKDVVIPIRKNKTGWLIRMPKDDEPYGVARGSDNVTTTGTTETRESSGVVSRVMSVLSTLRWKNMSTNGKLAVGVVIGHLLVGMFLLSLVLTV